VHVRVGQQRPGGRHGPGGRVAAAHRGQALLQRVAHPDQLARLRVGDDPQPLLRPVAGAEHGRHDGDDQREDGRGQLRQRQRPTLVQGAREKTFRARGGAGRAAGRPSPRGGALALNRVADAQPQGAAAGRGDRVVVQGARRRDDGGEVGARRGASRALIQMPADARVRLAGQRAVEEVAQQFMTLLAVHCS
jgi:hypothetical protein